MSEIFLYNSLAREKQAFVPIDKTNVRLYVCGPTVYDFAHIGNARPVVVFDLLYRLLCHTYGNEHVTYARNITDIDDKIMTRAEKDGVSIKAVSKKYTKYYQQDMAALGALEPDLEPKATDHLPEMIAMMRTLIEKGHAYVNESHVLFDVTTMANYGRLSGHAQEELIAGARIDVASYKKNPADFVLWKPSEDNQPGWTSPWGRGRPGWHLECSCMIEKHLGKTIDIHGGGQDLIFPHHENEIAQSECCHEEKFVNYWMHNGYLTVSGEKMSKSLGNFHTVHDLLKKHKGEVLRLSLMVAHYRQPIDFSLKNLGEQKKRLDRWYKLASTCDRDEAGRSDVPLQLIDALSDDLNTPKAIAALDGYANSGRLAELIAGAKFMGLLSEDPQIWLKDEAPEDISVEEIETLIEERQSAKTDKNFTRADEIRLYLETMGIALEDGPEGTQWRLL